MKGRIRRSLRSATTGSLVASSCGQLAVVVSGIAAARLLGVEDRGYLALLVLFPVALSQIGALGLPLAVTFEIARDARAARRVAQTIVAPALVQTIAITFLLALVLALVFWDAPDRVQLGAVIVLAAAPALIAQQYALAILQGQHRFTTFNVLRQVPAVLYALAVCGALAARVDALELVVALWVAAYVAAALWMAVAAARSLQGSREERRPPLRRMMGYGLKSLIGLLSPIEAFRLDQLLVGLVLSPTALGLYVIALAFTTFPRLIPYSIGVVSYPRIAAEGVRAAARRLAWRYFWICGALTAVFVACFEIAAPWVIEIAFGADFAGAATTARILLVSALFLSLRRALIDGAQGIGYPALGTISEVAMWVALVPMLVVLTPAWGIEGVATGLTIASGISLAVAVMLFALSEARLTSVAGAFLRRAAMRLRIAGRRAAPVAAVVAASLAAAALASILPAAVVVAIAAAGALVLLLALGRRALAFRPRSEQRDSSPHVAAADDEGDDAPHLRFPRVIYYLGLLFIGQLTFRPALSLTLSDWLFLASLLLTLAILATTERRPRGAIPSLLLVGAAMVGLGAVTATYRAEDWVASLAVTMRLLYLTLAWFWLATVLLRTSRHVVTAVAMWTASAAISGAAAVVQLLLGDVVPTARNEFGRLTGFTDHVNDLGGLAAVALVPAVALAVRGAGRGRLGAACYAVFLLLGAGLLLSGSVGGLIAALAGVFVWLAIARPPRRIWLIAGVAVVAAAVVVSLQADVGAPTPLERVTAVTAESDTESGTLWTRLDSYRFAWSAIEKDPLVGVGMDEASLIIPELGTPVHNLFLGFWHSAGILGVFGILVIVGSIARVAVRMVRYAPRSEAAILAPALLASFVAFVVFGMGAPIAYKRYGWVAAALILALAACSARARVSSEVRALPRASALRRAEPATRPT